MLFSGDTLFNRSIGRTDLPGGDGHLIIKSIKERIFTLADETLVTPGHGGKTRVYEEKKYNPFLC
jgi:hydroxyacylglutathione hydrolase